MRAAVVITLLIGARLASAQPATVPVGFDHVIHNRDVLVSGAESIPCTSCHVTRSGLLTGRPDHKACFGACHGAAPTRPKKSATAAIAPERMKVCTSCHAESVLLAPFTKAPVTYPPYTPTDFALEAPHKKHAAITCNQCHGYPGAGSESRPLHLGPKGVPHRRCTGCHDGSGAAGRGPAMTACEGCHSPGSGSPRPPAFAAPINTVSATFSHDKHARRGVAGAQCATCHAAILATDNSILPRPTMQTCGTRGCHDGKPAFAITTACTKCHTKQPPAFEVERPAERFSHLRAEHAGPNLPCATCHPLDKSGEVLVSGHAPCVACHADDFSERKPKKCGACHTATEPWRKLVADRLPRDDTEFGASLDHTKHPGACSSCHSLQTRSAQLRPPRGHRACTTAGCHAISSGPAPRIGSCEGCHALGSAANREALRIAPHWSVRTTFDHAPHLTAKDGTSVACGSCHLDLSSATVATLAAPPKKTCAPCHDGTIAFKLTGTTCTRCHQGATN
ncbi:MAG: hypothetical protein H0T42_15805 [Deltaproteobacteria bacterium]|nr:hypothetical protein [Deltaproteobacteria bacterium]